LKSLPKSSLFNLFSARFRRHSIYLTYVDISGAGGKFYGTIV